MHESSQIKTYFQNRNVRPEHLANYSLPLSLVMELPSSKGARILDIGCGFGHVLQALRRCGYKNISGIDISDEAVNVCQNIGLSVKQITDLASMAEKADDKYDFIIMTHVIEHIEKGQIIKTLRLIRERLLSSGGALYLTTPNAQSNTGCYWMYEDFTHSTIFTAGSLLYVLRSAGFQTVNFLDPADLMRHSLFVRFFKLLLLKIYKSWKMVGNKITASSYHLPSPAIYSFELKVLAK